jgi:anti-anti-sigma factor
MTMDRSKQNARSTKARRALPAVLPAEQSMEPIYIEVERSGDWMPAEELRKTALAASGENKNVIVNLGKVDHLDASALQILLALDADQKRRGHSLQLANASTHLRQWFEYAGVAECFLMTGPENDG